MRISDWSSGVCSSDLAAGAWRRSQRPQALRQLEGAGPGNPLALLRRRPGHHRLPPRAVGAAGTAHGQQPAQPGIPRLHRLLAAGHRAGQRHGAGVGPGMAPTYGFRRSEENTSELQSLMRISYAVFCLKKKKYITKQSDGENKTKRQKDHHQKEY